MAEKGPKKFSRFMRHFPTTFIVHRVLNIETSEYCCLSSIRIFTQNHLDDTGNSDSNYQQFIFWFAEYDKYIE